jgi:hypothetical protein
MLWGLLTDTRVPSNWCSCEGPVILSQGHYGNGHGNRFRHYKAFRPTAQGGEEGIYALPAEPPLCPAIVPKGAAMPCRY